MRVFVTGLLVCLFLGPSAGCKRPSNGSSPSVAKAASAAVPTEASAFEGLEALSRLPERTRAVIASAEPARLVASLKRFGLSAKALTGWLSRLGLGALAAPNGVAPDGFSVAHGLGAALWFDGGRRWAVFGAPTPRAARNPPEGWSQSQTGSTRVWRTGAWPTQGGALAQSARFQNAIARLRLGRLLAVWVDFQGLLTDLGAVATFGPLGDLVGNPGNLSLGLAVAGRALRLQGGWQLGAKAPIRRLLKAPIQPLPLLTTAPPAAPIVLATLSLDLPTLRALLARAAVLTGADPIAGLDTLSRVTGLNVVDALFLGLDGQIGVALTGDRLFPVTIGRLAQHAELYLALGVRDAGPLRALLDAIRGATRSVVARPTRDGFELSVAGRQLTLALGVHWLVVSTDSAWVASVRRGEPRAFSVGDAATDALLRAEPLTARLAVRAGLWTGGGSAPGALWVLTARPAASGLALNGGATLPTSP